MMPKVSSVLCWHSSICPPMNNLPQDSVTLAISSCLLGNEVRYDGGHKHNSYITKSLGRFFRFEAFCPEVAIGMGTPRDPIRLVKTADGVAARGIKDSSLDVTQKLKSYAQLLLPELTHISGYIFKKGSPSCGVERVKVYNHNGELIGTDSGVFACYIKQAVPHLPVEEEGRLCDPVLRENFIERVFIYARWQRGGSNSAQQIVEFHTRHKFNILAHDEVIYRELGRLVADAGNMPLDELQAQYLQMLMQALSKPASRKTHTNVLQHIMGYLKQQLDSQDKQELMELFDKYRLGHVPLIVPLTLLKHHLRRNPQDYILQQYYLSPHPDELMLRNSL